MKILMFGVLCLLFLSGTCFGDEEILASDVKLKTPDETSINATQVDNTTEITISSSHSDTTESIPTSIKPTEVSANAKIPDETSANATQVDNTTQITISSSYSDTTESIPTSIKPTEVSADAKNKPDANASSASNTAESIPTSINPTLASTNAMNKPNANASPPSNTAESIPSSTNPPIKSTDAMNKPDANASPSPQTAESIPTSINPSLASANAKIKLDTLSSTASISPPENLILIEQLPLPPNQFILPPLLDNGDKSEEIYVDSNPSARDASSTPIKSKVIDKIQNLSYNNSLLITNWLNSSAEKSYIPLISEPFDLSTLHSWTFEDTVFGLEEKIFTFTNITADRIRTAEPGFRFNKFSCQFSKQLQIDLDLTPEELLLKSQIHIIDKTNSKTAQGSFTLNQQGSRLLYKIPYFDDIDLKKINLSNYVHFKFDSEQIKVKHSLGGQIDIYAITKDLYKETEGHILRRIDNSIILTKLNQINNAFPFMSTCLSPPADSKPKYFVINTTSVKKYKSHALELGPIIIRGFDKLASSSIIANRSSSEYKSLNFSMVMVTELLYGQCDWKYFKDDHSDMINYSFTFTIENAKVVVNPEFGRNWSISNDIEIKLGSIKIHRLDKSCPKIYEFTKDLLREYLRYTIVTTLKEIFYKQYGKPKINSNPFKATYNIIVRKNASKGYDIDENKDNDGYKNYIPFPTRRVAAACTDKRNWFMRLFSRKKC